MYFIKANIGNAAMHIKKSFVNLSLNPFLDIMDFEWKNYNVRNNLRYRTADV